MFCFFLAFWVGMFQHDILAQTGPKTKIRIFDQTTVFDSIISRNDSILFFSKDTIVGVSLDTISDQDWFKIGTTNSPTSINDSIFTNGDIQLTDYPETRADDTIAQLNMLYTDAAGNVKSGRREIVPPAVSINIATTSSGNTFNYYNHYTTQVTNNGYTPIAITNLDFEVVYFDPGIFANVSISPLGILQYDVIATSAYGVIDVRFYTK